jgi:hypothetical protein
LSDLEYLEIYALNTNSNNLYIPIIIKSKNPKIIGILPGRMLLKIDPINNEQAKVMVYIKFINITDIGGIRIFEVP